MFSIVQVARYHHILNYIVSEIYALNFKEETSLFIEKKKGKTLTRIFVDTSKADRMCYCEPLRYLRYLVSCIVSKTF